MTQSNATVVETFSRRMRLSVDGASDVDAKIKGRRLKPVCGDRVVAEAIDGEDDWLITAIAPRSNELKRPNLRGQPEVLAANVDLVVVVAAATPKPDWFIVDRYLAAAEAMRADGVVVYNKADISPPDGGVLAVYTGIGYDTVITSAENGVGMQEFERHLAGRTAIVVGQSGVGKSSLINHVLGHDRQRTAEISEKHREGRHTTVNSIMLSFEGGGRVIDSPGVRDFAPSLASSTHAAEGFREISEASERCRFANCRHMQEPGCAVKDGVDAGDIDARRYESYRRVVITTERLTEKRY